MGSFIQIVNEGMKRKDISLRAVARELSLDPSFFSKVLAGKRTPPSDEKILNKLARLLEVDATRLIISTGLIPSELQPLFENQEFIDSVREQKPMRPIPPQRIRPVSAPVPVPQRSHHLSEDLL